MRNNFKCRILMFAPAFAPFANPEAVVNSKLALAFMEAGWEIDVITRNLAEESEYNYKSEWEEPWLPLKPITHVVSYSNCGKSTRILDTIRSGIRMHYPIEGCRWALHALRYGLSLAEKKTYDFVISRGGPDSGHLPALRFAAIKGKPWIANWNDPSGAKMPPPYGLGPEASLEFFRAAFLAKIAKKATWHTFPSERMQNYVSRYLPGNIKEKSSVIPHAALMQEQSHNVGSRDSFLICHAGRLSVERNPENLFLGIAQLLRENTPKRNIKLVLIGIDEVKTIELAKKHGIASNVELLGILNYKACREVMLKSDVLTVIEAPCEEGIFLPSKFVDYVEAGRPILAISPKSSTLNDILSSKGGGIAVDRNSADEIYKSLCDLYSSWELGVLDAKYSSSCLYHIFSSETIVAKYEEIFNKLGDPQIE